MKVSGWFLYTMFVFLSGLTVGMPIGMILNDLFHKWSTRIVDRIVRKFGWDRKAEE